MLKLWLALFSALLGIAPAQAQVNFTMPPPAGVSVGGVMVVTTCGMVNLTNGSLAYLAMDHTGALCTNASGGGGGGGLSVVDGAGFTASTSPFTPGGGEYASAPTTCADGKQCMVAITTQRAYTIDTPTSNNALYAAVTAPLAAGTNRVGYTSDDPCTNLTKTNLAIATISGTTQLVAASGSTQVYICSISTIGATASVQSLVGGTGASCTTGTPVAAIGSLVAASGLSFAANGGMTYGNGGGTVTRTTTAGHGICLVQSGTAAIAGNITYIQQ